MATGYQFPLFSGTGTGPGAQLGADGAVTNLVRFDVNLASTGTVNFEHTVDGTHWFALACKDMSSVSGAMATSATASGVYEADLAGAYGFRLNVQSNGSGITSTANKVVG